eukprot:scaffold41060_cov46-Phaeocystis_antarctica.AAC.1
MRRPYRAMPHALPSAAQVGRPCRICCRGGRWESKGRASERAGCFLVWETGIWEAFAPLVDPATLG